MKGTAGLILSLLTLALGWRFASAEAEPGYLYLSPLAIHMAENNDRGHDSDTGGQLGIGLAISDHWNMEGYMQRLSPQALPGGLAQKYGGGGVDFQYVFRRAERFSPYLFAGAGIATIENSSTGRENTAEMWAAGMGFFADIFGSSRVALRAEYRYREDHVSPRSDNQFIGLGLHIPFGRAAPRVADADGDGVPDSADRCPNTAMGVSVDEAGCPRTSDADGDGVEDARDQCPNTPPGVRVNAAGCPLDSDNDGVADNLDRCPNTVAGARVDANGCELDGDGDGVVDRLDRCPNTMRGVAVDVYGCEIRDEISLPDVNFETNSAQLLPSATTVLEDAAQTLLNNPSITVEVAGHTDSDGTAEYNQALSERRAAAVRDFIGARGVLANRLTVRGYGESQPTADNATAVGKAANRRVVLRVLSR